MPARRPWQSVRETRYRRFGPGVSASSALAAANSARFSRVGISVGVDRARSGRVSELLHKGSRRDFEGAAIVGGHLPAPDAEPVGVGLAREIRVNARPLLPLDHRSASMLATLEARDTRGALRPVVEHPGIVWERDGFAYPLERRFRLQHQI